MHVECPECIADYNRYMGGVDKGDQYRKYYQQHMKSRKCLCLCPQVCVLNSFILSHSSLCNHPISSFLAYRQQLSRELIGQYNSRKRQVISRATILHDLIVTTQHFPSKATKRTCTFHRCTRQTVWYCGTCDMHLCHTGDHTTDCFLLHHARNNLYHT